MPVQSFPLPLRIMEQLWRRFSWPSADRWTPHADWLYCPAEAYVPTKTGRLAVTIHDVAAFEPDLPWSHTDNHHRFLKRTAMMLRRMLADDALFLTVSEFSRRRLSELQSIDPSRIAVVGNGVEDEFFQPPAEDEVWRIGQSDPYILIVGGINERKGGEHVIRVAQLLLDRKSPLRIHVAGLHDAPLLEQAVRLSNITNLGFISDEQLLRATRGAALSIDALALRRLRHPGAGSDGRRCSGGRLMPHRAPRDCWRCRNHRAAGGCAGDRRSLLSVDRGCGIPRRGDRPGAEPCRQLSVGAVCRSVAGALQVHK